MELLNWILEHDNNIIINIGSNGIQPNCLLIEMSILGGFNRGVKIISQEDFQYIEAILDFMLEELTQFDKQLKF